MKIVLTGGGTGGHFYPIIAVTEAIRELTEEERLLPPELIFMSPTEYDGELLRKEGLIFQKIYAGKVRRYFSLLNITDLVKTAAGILKAIWIIYSKMPDVIFGKGGYASFPVLLAAKILRIPVIIHESDAVPGKVNTWAGKFARKIAIAFPEAARYFPAQKTALVGIPVRKNILNSSQEEAREMFGLEVNTPTLLILGGSQGCQKLNDTIIEIATDLVQNWQVIHQCGKNNEQEVKARTGVVLENSVFKNRYHLFPFLDDQHLRGAAGAANLVISRAGGSAIYEIAAWNLPSVLIPLKNAAQDHQRENAYSYAETGATTVIEENNLSPHVLLSEIQRLTGDNAKMERMKNAAQKFFKPEAARKIAKEIMDLALEHSS